MLPDSQCRFSPPKTLQQYQLFSVPASIPLRLELGAFFLRGFVELFPSHPKKFSTAFQ